MSKQYDYDLCDCKNKKARKSKSCWNCYSSTRLALYSRFNLCQCGVSKKKSSQLCQDCYHKSRVTMNIRGPLPLEEEAAIYLLRGPDNKVFYVGSSKNPLSRIASHKQTFGDVMMLIIKIVPIQTRWSEEVEAMMHYGIVSIGNSRDHDQ